MRYGEGLIDQYIAKSVRSLAVRSDGFSQRPGELVRGTGFPPFNGG
jgi:hypothetical protein